MKPFCQATENNRIPVLEVLTRVFEYQRCVLEIGSGTGQHAVYFAPDMPHLRWQTSDQIFNHAGINLWIDAHPSSNLHRPVGLDVDSSDDWGNLSFLAENSHGGLAFDGVFTANTAHIMSWSSVRNMFAGVSALFSRADTGGSQPVAKFVIYGPFNRNGEFTSQGNRDFNASLQKQDPLMGIRDDTEMVQLGRHHSLFLHDDIAMPANNRLLVFHFREPENHRTHKNSAERFDNALK